MKPILLFALATIVNVTLSTVRSITTIKSGRWVAATMNALCYGFYPLIVLLTAKGTVYIAVNMCITAAVNFVCVWIIKLVEERARKDKMWKVEIAVHQQETELVAATLARKDISYNFTNTGKWTIFNCYCDTQEESSYCANIAKQLHGKISAYESKNIF